MHSLLDAYYAKRKDADERPAAAAAVYGLRDELFGARASAEIAKTPKPRAPRATPTAPKAAAKKRGRK